MAEIGTRPSRRAFCGGIHPNFQTVAFTFDLATGKTVDWVKLLPAPLIETTTTEGAMDGATMGLVRSKLLVKLADLFLEHADLLSAVEALDNGKAFTMAKNVDVPAAAGCLRYYGGWADKIEGKVVDTSPDTFNYIRKEPVSTVLATLFASY